MSEPNEDGSDDENKFFISLQIKHLPLDPEEMTRQLRMSPTRTWNAGERRRTPTGRPLSGVNKTGYWATSLQIKDRRDFFASALEFLQSIPNKGVIKDVTDAGGEAILTIQLYGGQNIGDCLSLSKFDLFRDLGIQLGVEVFPDMR